MYNFCCRIVESQVVSTLKISEKIVRKLYSHNAQFPFSPNLPQPNTSIEMVTWPQFPGTGEGSIILMSEIFAENGE